MASPVREDFPVATPVFEAEGEGESIMEKRGVFALRKIIIVSVLVAFVAMIWGVWGAWASDGAVLQKQRVCAGRVGCWLGVGCGWNGCGGCERGEGCDVLVRI